MKKVVMLGLLGLATIATTLVFLPQGGFGSPSEASAVIGRPLTPVSAAGVARRTARRRY